MADLTPGTGLTPENREVLMNLMGNAIQFTGWGEVVVGIEAESPGGSGWARP